MEIQKKMLGQGICFALCFFAFQLTEFTINDRAEELLGATKVNGVYSIGIACTALGFLSFSLLRKVFEGTTIRKWITCVVCVLSVVASISLLTTTSGAWFLGNAMLALLAYGHIGGNVYYHAAMTFAGKACTGRIIGIGMGCAVLLQFIVQNLLVDKLAFMGSIIISVGILIYFVIRPQRDWMFENPLPYSAKETTDQKEAFPLVAATLLMSLVIALIDGIVVQKHALGSLSVSSYARLFYAISLPVAGIIADLKNRKYMALVTVCTLFISTIATAFMTEPTTFFLATSCLYIYSGFYVMYFTIALLDFAPKTKDPAFWAGFGRVLRGGITALVTVPTVWCYERFGSAPLVVGSCLFSVITLLVLFPTMSKALFMTKEEKSETEAEPTAPKTMEEQIAAYAEQYGFTPREQEVFETLITTEDGVQEIADGMFISRRVLQRYISSIYEKTGTKTRIGLLQSFNRANNQ